VYFYNPNNIGPLLGAGNISIDNSALQLLHG